ncbi:hypothetical protein JIG36_36015 [Actinoplanes sp. LDG1-06]|uniref:NB-ARC domain-containing protein n=1 Tax=Paractinoplanes ovalisporus TaxID=2810368 RepID=A0ABS2AM84_9ACTN|nr:NB-ARC domain-containing protein [Actinoplanes ovalisporus]MBM2620920.1 hypothetical protein [Actinoplanes ovalisporus]
MRTLRVGGAALLAALAAALSGVAINAATGSRAPWFPTMDSHYLWWVAASVVAVSVAALVSAHVVDNRLVALVPARHQVEPWVEDRPAEVNLIVRALRRRGARTVGITTAVHGAGGFGKTTVARMVRSDRRILRRFRGRVYWVTLGRDTRRGGLVEQVNDLVRQLAPDRAQPFTDVRQAADHLAAVLAAGPRRLLILDDVWFDDQLAAFPVAGRAARLVTTRNPALVGADGVPVKVDQMSSSQARKVLTAGLPELSPALVESLLAETGRWPLLLRLLNKILVEQLRLRSDAGSLATELLSHLRRGVSSIDNLTGVPVRELDLDDPDQRDDAIAATIEASTSLLDQAERQLFTELAVFAEDETIPESLVSALWERTSDRSRPESVALCGKLARLALITAADNGTITLHDVVRDYLGAELGESRIRDLHGFLVEAAVPDISEAWRQPVSNRYLGDHLIQHLIAAGRGEVAEAVATDFRWAEARFRASGPLAPHADLSLVEGSRAERLRRLLGQISHLVRPTLPESSAVDIFYSRTAHDADWGPPARAAAETAGWPGLVADWPLPDVPNPALRRTLTGHDDAVRALAIAPDGSWLASAGDDRTIRIWDPHTGRQLRRIDCQQNWTAAIEISPDGTWIASAGADRTVRLWDSRTGRQRLRLSGHRLPVSAVAISPDGTWLASASQDSTIRIWDTGSGKELRQLRAQTEPLVALVVGPDGRWLASGSAEGTIRTWDTATGTEQQSFRTLPITSLTVHSDGRSIVAGAFSGELTVWDPAVPSESQRMVDRPGTLKALACSPDGMWLATGSDAKVELRHPGTGLLLSELAGHMSTVTDLTFAPDGSWLASSSDDGTIRVWDPAAAALVQDSTRPPSRVTSLAVAPDGTWLAAAGTVGLRIIDGVTAATRFRLDGYAREPYQILGTAPDGSWLRAAVARGVLTWGSKTGEVLDGSPPRRADRAAQSHDGTWFATSHRQGSIHLWDADTHMQLMRLSCRNRYVTALAVAVDGSWLAAACQGRARPGGSDGARRVIQIWDAATGAERVFIRQTSEVHALAASPDGTWLASASLQPWIRIWDSGTGRHLRDLDGHVGGATDLAVAVDGGLLASVGRDQSVRVWDLTTFSCVAVMRLEQPIAHCAWDSGGNVLFVGGEAGLYRFTFRRLAHDSPERHSEPGLRSG